MRGGGLVEVADASARFVGEATRAPGSVVLAAMEGSRPLLVEVQALVTRRRSSRRAGSPTGSTATGSRSCSPCSAATPAWGWAARTSSSTSRAACASTSRGPTSRSRSRWQRPARRGAGDGERPIACFGELGLSGELRSVAHPDRREAEARKFGLTPWSRPTARRPCGPLCGRRCRPNRAPAPPDGRYCGVRAALWLPLAAILGLALPASASACSCAKLPEAKRFKDADAAFTGQARLAPCARPRPRRRGELGRPVRPPVPRRAPLQGPAVPHGVGADRARRGDVRPADPAARSRSTWSGSEGTGRVGCAASPPGAMRRAARGIRAGAAGACPP